VAGITLLLCFIVGLVAANTVVAITAAIGLLGASRNFPLLATVSVMTAVFSLVVGAMFVLGRSAVLPPMLSG
jgi:high-affinity nickel-transport protein